MGPRALTEDERHHFENRGFAIVKNVLSDADFAAFERDYGALVDRKANELATLGLVDREADECLAAAAAATSLRRRLAALAEQLDDEAFDANLRPFGDACDCMVARVRGFHELLYAPRLLDVVESLVGPEVAVNPIQHVRPFLPARRAGVRGGGRGDAAAGSEMTYVAGDGAARTDPPARRR